MSLADENRALVGRVYSQIPEDSGVDWNISDAQLNFLLNAARAEGRAQGQEAEGESGVAPGQKARPQDHVPDAAELRDALHDLVMLNAQDEIGCVPAPTREQWRKAWAVAEELVRVEP